MRYYYTDLLKAVWMCDAFGFRFEIEDLPYFFPQIYVDIIDYGTAYKVSLSGRTRVAKYYIHPDSIPLLQPQEGDRNIDGLIFEKGQWIGLGYAYSGYNYNNRDIDKRNGKVWFTPEVES